MTLPLFAVVLGLILLVWSADKFVDGSAAAARHLGMPPLLIGMVIVGFGTSAPEMAVSALAASQGNSGIALGNAYGSNIANIALILGITAMIAPITVHSQVLRKELPILAAVTFLGGYQLSDGRMARINGVVLLIVLTALMTWSIRQGLQKKADAWAGETEKEIDELAMPMKKAMFWIILGLVMLIASSRTLVWGSVEIARFFGVSDLIIGLTIVAIGTSLPELASSIAANRKNEHDIALGNVLGSNLFNTLAVVGIAGVIHPIEVGPEILTRDILVLSVLTLSLFIIGYGFKRPGRINRYEGAGLFICYVGYVVYLIVGEFGDKQFP